MDTMILGGKKYVLVPEDEYKVLISHATPLPAAVNAQGDRPAVAYAVASIGRQLTTERAKLGLTQKQLADAAGIRPEILNRAERGTTVPSGRTLQKLSAALTRLSAPAKPAKKPRRSA